MKLAHTDGVVVRSIQSFPALRLVPLISIGFSVGEGTLWSIAWALAPSRINAAPLVLEGYEHAIRAAHESIGRQL